jgi:hypothetical protein
MPASTVACVGYIKGAALPMAAVAIFEEAYKKPGA